MSLHPTARALLEALAGTWRVDGGRVFLKAWTGFDPSAADEAVRTWLAAGCPIDGAPAAMTRCSATDTLDGQCERELGHTGGHHYTLGFVLPSAPAEPSELEQAEAWAVCEGFRKHDGHWCGIYGGAVQWQSDVEMLAAYKARPREEANKAETPEEALARYRALFPMVSTEDVHVRLQRHEAAIVEAANALSAHERLLNAIHDRLAALEKT